MSTPRRRFLGLLGGASLLGVAGSPSLARAAILPPPEPSPAPNDHPPPVSDTWDVSWTARITGTYKAVFDSPEPAGGAGLVRAVAWCEQYKEVYGAERSAMSPVLVLRHTAIDLAMNDEYWGRFDIGKSLKLRDAQGKKWSRVNPISARPAGGDAKPNKYTLQVFMESGGIVLACGWALRFVSGRYAKADTLDAAAAMARAKDQMVPGVILQPNGIFAALRAQEAGCAYVLAS